MKINVLICPLLAAVLTGVCLSAQETQGPLHPLRVGDKVPDIALGKIVHYKTRTAKLSDFRGRLIILDFWAIYCTPCVRDLYKLDSLQKKFGDKIVVLPVNELSSRENEAKITAFFAGRKTLDLPSIVEDESLTRLFPHHMIPHEVWIDGTGVVVAITHGEEVTAAHIAKVLTRETVALRQKKDLDIDEGKPLFVNGNGGSADDFKYRSILTEAVDGLGSMFGNPDGKGHMKNFWMNKVSSLQLYYHAFAKGKARFPVNVKRVIYEMADSSYGISQDDYIHSWEREKHYCYSLDLPKPVADSLFFGKYMMEDLNRCFMIKGRVEKRKIPSLVLIRTGKDTDKLLLTKTDTVVNYGYTEGHGILVKAYHQHFNDIVDILNGYPDTPPVVNETGYTTQRVDMELNLKMSRDDGWNKPLDVETLRIALRKYGLDIIEANDRPAEVLVLSDK